MEILSLDQVQNELRAPNRSPEIDEAIKHDYRAQFHTVPNTQPGSIKYLNEYLGFVGELIDSNKFQVFKHLLQFPIETVDFCEGVFSQLKKIFTAPDRVVHHTFSNPELEQDYNTYLKSISNDEFWQSKAFEAMKYAVNSVLIVDLETDPEQRELPEPYCYLLDIRNVISIRQDDNNNCEWIIFKNKDNPQMIHQFDSLYYRTFSEVDGRYNLLSENTHDLGYTPAKMFWSVSFDSTKRIQKRGIITNALGKLDWLLTEYVFKKHETAYSGFPVDIMYEQKCNYQDNQGNICEDGYINISVKSHGHSRQEFEQVKEPCPKCNTNKPMLGPGTMLTAPARSDERDPDMINGLNRVGADVDGLDWISGDIQEAERNITWNMIGYLHDESKEAMNEMQVAGNKESREVVIMDVKRNFEKAHSFVLNTIGLLRYGANSYGGTVVNYGENHFLKSPGKMKEALKESKDTGMPFYEIANQQKQYLYTKYQNNPEMMQRVNILSQLEPYQGYNISELLEIKQNIPLKQDQIIIKANFPDFIQRFELEYMNIVSFMQFNDFRQKIEFIKGKLSEYAEEIDLKYVEAQKGIDNNAINH